jgi:hypothetical protein
MDSKSTNDLTDALNGSASAGLVVQSYCTQVLNQPDIGIPSSLTDQLPPINKYLADARTHANDYLNTVQPQIIAVVTDVGGYSQQFAAFYGLINQKLQDWSGGNQGAKAEALALLQQLQSGIDTRKQNIDKVRDLVGTFRTNVNQDASNFNTAVTRADVVIGGDQGAIAQLQNSIDELDKQIGGAATGVALSGLAIIGGIFVVAVGAVAGFVTAGTSTPVVIGGVALIVAGVAGLTASSIVLAKLIDTKAGLLQQKTQLQADLTFLHNFKSTVGQLASSAEAASTQLNNVYNAWTILGKDMGNVVTSVSNARSFSELPVVVQAYLDSANRQWATVQQNVQTIENQMSGVQTSVLKDNSGNLTSLNSDVLNGLAKAA